MAPMSSALAAVAVTNANGTVTTNLWILPIGMAMAGCDFRCPFCHNSSLVLNPKSAPTIPWDEILEYLRQRKNVLDAVCVTGGEPTMMPDLLEKLTQIKQLGYIIKLDSNGSRPEVLRVAVEQGLVDYVAMDIKNSKEKYAMTVGTSAFKMEDIEESVRFLIDGRIPYEFRTTSILEYHNQHDFEEIGAWLEGAQRYYLQRYIDSENCISHGTTYYFNGSALIDWGTLLNAIISFLVIALVLFIVVKMVARAQAAKAELQARAQEEYYKVHPEERPAPVVPGAPAPTEMDILVQIRDELKKQNAPAHAEEK